MWSTPVTNYFIDQLLFLFQTLTGPELVAELQKHSEAKLVVIEGYPKSKEQVEEFNKQVSWWSSHVCKWLDGQAMCVRDFSKSVSAQAMRTVAIMHLLSWNLQFTGQLFPRQWTRTFAYY